MSNVAAWLSHQPGMLLKWIAALLLGFCISMMAWGFGTDPTTLPHRLWAKYVVFLNGWLRQLFLPPTGARMAACQAGLLFLAVLAGLLGVPFWYAAALMIVVGPLVYLKRRRNERLVKIEAQVVPFTMGLANALKSTANIGTALEVLEPMLAPPLQQDLGLALKEIRVGSPVEQSLCAMAARSRSPELEATLAAVLIGRHVGGNLPEILDTTSRTLREITRLAGAVRAKTASGRSQLWVLGAAPAVVLVLFEMVKPGYFDPLTASTIGWVVSMIIALLWVVGVILARKIMQVDV